MRAEDLFAEIEQSDPEFRDTWAIEGPKLKLGLNVYRLRSERGWTQEELASRAGMRQPRIAEIERGDGNPKFETLIRLANAFGICLSALVSSEPTKSEAIDCSVDWAVFAQSHALHDDVLASYTPQFGSPIRLVAKTRERPLTPSRGVFANIGVLEALERIHFDAKGNHSLFEESADEEWTFGFKRQA
jgi:transcriptional regulator with XRE-family HTH domain